jgi:hypothetical protein
MKYLYPAFIMVCLLTFSPGVNSQDLDPRAYVRSPVNATFVSAGFGYSHGGVVTDATLPIKDINATVYTTSLIGGHTFALFGQTAQVSAALPYTWADVSGSIGENRKSVSRSGFSDLRLRISLLFHGAPAASIAELAKAPRRTVLGTSISIVAPTGQYFSDKLINIGTHRWAIKPELALSQPAGSRWLFDFYAALWVFTTNSSYYPGHSIRKQDPMGAFQTHISYTIRPGLWGALDLTYYTGGKSTIDGDPKDDLQSNSRFGFTMGIPVGKKHSIKIAFSKGAVVTRGADFTTLSFGWQTFFLGKQKAHAPAKQD